MIKINPTPNADSRSGGMNITIEQLEQSTADHIGHVQQGLMYFAKVIAVAGSMHDATKLQYMEDFHETITTQTPGEGVKASPWYKMHISRERHHLMSKAPDDVNLVDVLEYITDCVMAGMSRTGTVTKLELPDKLLQEAFQNTVEMLKGQVKIIDEEDTEDVDDDQTT